MPSKWRPASGSSAPSDADREQRRSERSADDGEHGTTERDGQCLEATRRDALAAGEPERTLGRLVRRGRRDLSAEHDRDGHQSREGGDTGEHPQCDGQYVDRVLRALGVDREILHAELRGSEDPACGRGDLRNILSSVASADAQDRAVEAP